jgi:hypothetical protein
MKHYTSKGAFSPLSTPADSFEAVRPLALLLRRLFFTLLKHESSPSLLECLASWFGVIPWLIKTVLGVESVINGSF